MIATLLDVFDISGRGCVALLDIQSGNCRVGDRLIIGTQNWPIAGIEMPNYGPDAVRRIAEGWIPPTGVLLHGATKHELLSLIGEAVSAASDENASPTHA